MAFFNRFFGNSSVATTKKKEQQEEGNQVWSQHFTKMPENCSVRLVLFRECDRKGKKLLFDSSTVEKHQIEAGRDIDRDNFTEVGDGCGYKYLQPPAKDVRYEIID